MHSLAYVNSLDFRTNLSASTNFKAILQEPVTGVVHRINWFNWNTHAESGGISISDAYYLVEGPLPGDQSAVGLDQNLARNDGALKVLLAFHPSGSTSTSDPNTGAGAAVGFVPIPGGIWTVEKMFVGYRTSGGVDRVHFSIGWEKIRIPKADWLDLVSASPNARQAGDLIQ